MNECVWEPTGVSSVLQTLIQFAVAEVYKLLEEQSSFVVELQKEKEEVEKVEKEEKLSAGGEHVQGLIEEQIQHRMKQFASVMEVLGNEALGKIINLMDETSKMVLVKGVKHPADILNILSAGGLEEEHSYDGCRKSSEGKTKNEISYFEEPGCPESLFTSAVSFKDQSGNADVIAIVSDHLEPVSTDVQTQGEHVEEMPSSETRWDVVELGVKSFFVCCECGITFLSVNELSAHQQVHVGENSLASNRSQKTVGKEKVCGVCGKSFKKATQLKAHKLIHTGERPFSCDACGKKFNLAQNLSRHRRIHREQKNFTCTVCDKSFSRANTLLNHQLIHTGQKPHSCELCGRDFRHLVNLRNHQLIHTDLRPYLCDLCGKAFRHSVNLKIHKRIHTGEKPFTCQDCGKSFSQKSSLMSHSRTHSGLRPFGCGYCKKHFNNANSLKLHERTHTGEKPYVCDVCGKCFIQGSHLRTHKRHLHAGGKQFICDKCGKRYADPRNLKLHKCVYA